MVRLPGWLHILWGRVMNKYFSSHTLFIPHRKNKFIIYQCMLRKGVLTDIESLSVLFHYLYMGDINENQIVRFKDLSCFSLSECLLDNPAGIAWDASTKLGDFSLPEFIIILEQLDLLVEDATYHTKVGKQTNLFDKTHIGNFHQQIGSYLLGKRDDPEKWWISQKFENNFEKIKDNPYLWVQNHFLKNFFDHDLSGQDWLDFGCGIGYYSCFFSKKNANVLGVDPSQIYLDIAKQQFSDDGKVEFLSGKFESEKDFEILGQRTFDRIYMSDVFLYYFEPYKPLVLSAVDLLKQLKKRLNKGGRVFILDPHGCFHLQPWMGNKNPFLISTEYVHRKYRVTPTLEEVSKSVEAAGLCIRKIRELGHEDETDLTTQAKKITREFPLWWFFELATV